MKITALVLCVLFLICSAGPSFGEGVGTKAEAKAMVEKAASYLKTYGKEKSFAEFMQPKGQFKDRDLYIYALDKTGKVLAHGGIPSLVGMDFSKTKDADGKLFIKEILDGAQTNGSGWVDYKWTNPVSKKIEPKSAYFLRADDVVLGCGAYK